MVLLIVAFLIYASYVRIDITLGHRQGFRAVNWTTAATFPLSSFLASRRQYLADAISEFSHQPGPAPKEGQGKLAQEVGRVFFCQIVRI